MVNKEQQQQAFTRAASALRLQGIIAIIFGSLGTFLGFILMAIFALALGTTYSQTETIEFLVYFVVSIVFVLVPHAYYVVSGVLLIRQPEPKLARTLTITNLIVGALSNYIVLAFAIISLVQQKDYEEGYTVQQ